MVLSRWGRRSTFMRRDAREERRDFSSKMPRIMSNLPDFPRRPFLYAHLCVYTKSMAGLIGRLVWPTPCWIQWIVKVPKPPEHAQIFYNQSKIKNQKSKIKKETQTIPIDGGKLQYSSGSIANNLTIKCSNNKYNQLLDCYFCLSLTSISFLLSENCQHNCADE